uniref:Uncharacterized protein n=1 Tax=Setaria viridis TaxID=4556 RepID=A0A4U6UNV7_SETVI|nr:hypothetical protein SEVIR_5G035600v2 [Setaria viridis]
MASLGGDDAGDPKQKLGDGVHHSRQQHAAGMRFNYGSRDEPPHSFDTMMRPSDDGQSSSSSSTRQMLGSQHANDWSSSFRSGVFVS